MIMYNGLMEDMKNAISKGLLKDRIGCIYYAVGYLERSRKSVPFEVIDLIDALYRDSLIE